MPSLATFIGEDLKTIFLDIGQEAALREVVYTLDANEKLRNNTITLHPSTVHMQPITATNDSQLISAGIADIGDMRCWILPPDEQAGLTVKPRDEITFAGEIWEVVGLITGKWRWDSVEGFIEAVLRKKPDTR